MMKNFIYDNRIDKPQSDKIIRRLIYTFFKGNIRKKKIMIDGKLKDKTYFCFKTPFNASDGSVAYPKQILQALTSYVYVLRHYAIDDNKNPLFYVSSQELVFDLNNIDELSFYEYSYIFDKNFTDCFFVTDSGYDDGHNHTAILLHYKPLL